MMTRLKTIQHIATPEFNHRANIIFEVDAEFAAVLVKDGVAEYVDGPPVEPEIADALPVRSQTAETADLKPKKKKVAK